MDIRIEDRAEGFLARIRLTREELGIAEQGRKLSVPVDHPSDLEALLNAHPYTAPRLNRAEVYVIEDEGA